MGGEPTFVATSNRDAEEWNTAALGVHKHSLADKLLHHLQHRFAPGSLLHHGQGKWYPGETLPRWALSCCWHTDGVPVWNNPRLQGDENERPGYGVDDARRFIETLAMVLGVDAKHAIPGYEAPAASCRARAGCPPTSIRLRASWKTRKNARGWPASSITGWARSSAMPCPCGTPASPERQRREGRRHAG